MHSNQVSSGNNCGHNPNQLRFTTQPKSERRPWPIRNAHEKFRKASLSVKHFNKHIPYRNATNRLKKTENVNRLTRSEGRERHTSIGDYLWHYLEFATMTVVKNDKHFSYPTYKEIARDTLTTVTRVDEEITWLRSEGLVETRPDLYTNSKGKTRTRATIITITPKWWVNLKLGEQYNLQRNYKAKKESKSLRAKEIAESMARASKKKKAPLNTSKKGYDAEKSKLIQEYLRLVPSASQYPDYVNSRSVEQLKKIIQTRPPDSS